MTDSIAGQHLALSVAAHLARTQLVPDPLTVYDGQHLSEMLDVVGNALARVAPLYVQDPASGTPRQLMEADLEGARVKRGANVLALKDGRSLSGVSIKRADLRQAIAILKAVGIPELAARVLREPAKPPPTPDDRRAELRAALDEVERLVCLPLVTTQAERANARLLLIARHADGAISNLAMRLMSAVHEARDHPQPDGRQIGLMLARLRAALEETPP